jgi:hypothetical protein
MPSFFNSIAFILYSLIVSLIHLYSNSGRNAAPSSNLSLSSYVPLSFFRDRAGTMTNNIELRTPTTNGQAPSKWYARANSGHGTSDSQERRGLVSHHHTTHVIGEDEDD